MKENNVHYVKLIALFLAMEEESNFLIGNEKRESKMIFNRWRKETMKLVKLIEKSSDMDYLDDLKDKIHNSIKKI